MHPYLSEQKRHQQKAPGGGLQRFLFILILLSLTAMIVCLLVLGQLWHASNMSEQNPNPTPVVTLSPHPSPTLVPTPTPTASLAQRIDTYIDHLTQTQQIGQLLMLAVYTNGYTAALNQPLQHWDIANVIVFNNYNGGPLMPTTLSGWTQLVHDLQTHANQSLIIATDEEGGIVDRLAPY